MPGPSCLRRPGRGGSPAEQKEKVKGQSATAAAAVVRSDFSFNTNEKTKGQQMERKRREEGWKNESESESEGGGGQENLKDAVFELALPELVDPEVEVPLEENLQLVLHLPLRPNGRRLPWRR